MTPCYVSECICFMFNDKKISLNEMVCVFAAYTDAYEEYLRLK